MWLTWYGFCLSMYRDVWHWLWHKITTENVKEEKYLLVVFTFPFRCSHRIIYLFRPFVSLSRLNVIGKTHGTFFHWPQSCRKCDAGFIMLRCYYYSMYCYAFRCYSAAHNSFGVDLPPTFRYFWQGDLTEEHMLVSSSSSSMYVSGAIEQRRLNAHRLRACVYPLSRYEFNWELAKPVSQYPLMVEYWQTPSNFSYTVGYQWIDDWKKKLKI